MSLDPKPKALNRLEEIGARRNSPFCVSVGENPDRAEGVAMKVVPWPFLETLPYLEGEGDLVSRLIGPRTYKVALVIPILNPLTKSLSMYILRPTPKAPKS